MRKIKFLKQKKRKEGYISYVINVNMSSDMKFP